MACNLFTEYKPDLVLLDIMLPGMDGIEVLKWIRKNNEIPVIMLTAKVLTSIFSSSLTYKFFSSTLVKHTS